MFLRSTHVAWGLWLGLLVTPDAWAQVNRCVNADGKVVYSDSACEYGGAVRDLQSSQRLSGIVLVHYDVRGSNGATVLAEMTRLGPRGFHGLANWNFDYNYRYAPQSDGRCKVSSVNLDVRGRIMMPRWLDEPTADADLRRSWAKFYQALMRHEEGHIAHGQALIRVLRKELESITAPTCEELRRSVDQTAARLLEEYKERDRRYDADTQHGLKQGTRFVFK